MNSVSSRVFYKPIDEIGIVGKDLFRRRDCDTNLTANTPANQYQRLKRIYNTVGVASSVYTMNLGGLNAYEVPNSKYETVNVAGSNYLVSPGVNWNQMSDRRRPHIQFSSQPHGTIRAGSLLKRSSARYLPGLKPGVYSPGGSGVDIKHNSYDRYLNRLKGRAPLRRGFVPPDFGVAILGFNRAFPIYGGKTTKPSIVANCNCPVALDNDALEIKLYENASQSFVI
jgi:hypothetical protein